MIIFLVEDPFTKHQISYQIPNVAYQIQNSVFLLKVHFNSRRTIYHIPSYHGVYTFLAGYLVLSCQNGITEYDMVSCIVHLIERERNIIFCWRNIMFGWRNLHMLSSYFVYFQYILNSSKP